MVDAADNMTTYDRAAGDTLLTMVSLTVDFQLMVWWIVLCHVELGRPAAMANG